MDSLDREFAVGQCGDGEAQRLVVVDVAARRLPVGVTERSSGPVVDWLATTLAALDGAPAPAGAQTYSAPLKARVQALQRAQGLEADGQVGPMTFMQINRVAGVDEPRLGAP